MFLSFKMFNCVELTHCVESEVKLTKVRNLARFFSMISSTLVLCSIHLVEVLSLLHNLCISVFSLQFMKWCIWMGKLL